MQRLRMRGGDVAKKGNQWEICPMVPNVHDSFVSPLNAPHPSRDADRPYPLFFSSHHLISNLGHIGGVHDHNLNRTVERPDQERRQASLVGRLAETYCPVG